MLQHHGRLQEEESPSSEVIIALVKKDVHNLHKIEKSVIVTIALFAILFLLSGPKKRFPKVWPIKIISTACYALIPILFSYTLGLMGQSATGATLGLPTLYSIWAVFLMFSYASFDNLNVFSIKERDGRTNLFFQFFIHFALIVLLVYDLQPFKHEVLPLLLAFLVVCLKVVERIVTLAHAAGATPGIKNSLRNMINYMNVDEEVEVDPVSMHGFRYLVGPRYSKIKDGVIVEGVSIENIWGCNGRLLSSESGGGDPDGKLKDTCLSFAFFWLLLGKFWGYRLYKGESRRKAWKLVHGGLFAGKFGESERVFRVIEVELSFLRDYFYTKYIFFYLNGFRWKLCILAFPIMFWWFTQKAFDYAGYNSLYTNFFESPAGINPQYTTIVILVVFCLEVLQLCMLISSRWFKVALLSYYAKREMSKKKCRLLNWCLEKVVGVIYRISQCTSTIFFKPWKRELDQYSLLDSCTCCSVDNNFLQGISSVIGIPLPKQGMKQGKSVVLSENVKRAVVLSLQTNGHQLSNGIASLMRNEVEEGLSWACKLDCDIEIILVWHIATRICEMSPKSQLIGTQSTEDFKVATSLSKYCAYLLAFSPSLLHVPLLEAEAICGIAIIEARKLFKKPGSLCGFVDKVNKYDKLMELVSDKEAGARRTTTTIQRGAKLGEELLFIVKDEGKRWKILAEFWAEMILFLAPSNNNEMVHVEKLAEGGEFITHLWALLIHAGIVDRDN